METDFDPHAAQDGAASRERQHRSSAAAAPCLATLGAGCLRGVGQGQHVCLLYEDRAAAQAEAAAFVAAGLAAGERCIYLLGEHDPQQVRAALLAAGVAVERETAAGALLLIAPAEVSFPSGRFEPAAMIEYVRHAIADAIAAGHRGLRVAAEMTWALQLGVDANRLIHYEALGNDLYPDQPLVAVCMYDRARFPAEVCRDALRVHPWVADAEAVYENLYFEPPASVVGERQAADRVERMLMQLRQARATEQQRLTVLQAQAAQAEAEAAAQAREELLSLLAHELRTPLTSMRTYAQLALRQLERTQRVDINLFRETLQLVVRQAGKQAQLIEQVLDAARLATDQLPVTPVPCDLTALVRETVQLTQTLDDSRPIQLQAEQLGLLVLDPLRIEEVLSNLLDNARKYGAAHTAIEVRVYAEGDTAIVSVRDHGAGIPAAQRERIFQRFQRGHRDRQGLGLGLHISREIVRLHGGELSIESPDEDGSRFVVRLPRRVVGA